MSEEMNEHDRAKGFAAHWMGKIMDEASATGDVCSTCLLIEMAQMALTNFRLNMIMRGMGVSKIDEIVAEASREAEQDAINAAERLKKMFAMAPDLISSSLGDKDDKGSMH